MSRIVSCPDCEEDVEITSPVGEIVIGDPFEVTIVEEYDEDDDEF